MKKKMWKKIKAAVVASAVTAVLITSADGQALSVMAENMAKCSCMQETEEFEDGVYEESGNEEGDVIPEIDEGSEDEDAGEEILIDGEASDMPQERPSEDVSPEDIVSGLPLLGEMESEALEENSEILTDSELEEDMTVDQVGEELELRAEVFSDTAAAGKKLLYKIELKNTGSTVLHKIRLAVEGIEDLTPLWEEGNGDALPEAEVERLEAGESKVLYLGFSLPEDRVDPVEMSLSATARFQAEEAPVITKKIDIRTEIQSLTADFQVTKTVDRGIALPGDVVTFYICIRNTGERTLHSIVTTEKFQLEKVPVRFLEQEGVILNSSRTRALIRSLAPGAAVSLRAQVTIPMTLKERELINKVEVVSRETGERVITSQAELQVYEADSQEEESESPEENTGYHNRRLSSHVSNNPQTGDVSQIVSMGLICVAAMVVIWLIIFFIWKNRTSE